MNGSLLTASKGKIVFHDSFGMTNWEHSVPNTPNTRFRIGSLTKAFTAMAIFQLYEEQKLDLEATIDNYIPDYPNGNRITVYHLLTHTSGIPDFASRADFWPRKMRLPISLHEMIHDFKDDNLEFEPGTQFVYSNSGYILLTLTASSEQTTKATEQITKHAQEMAEGAETQVNHIQLASKTSADLNTYVQTITAAVSVLKNQASTASVQSELGGNR